jgi:hypothetical protein
MTSEEIGMAKWNLRRGDVQEALRILVALDALPAMNDEERQWKKDTERSVLMICGDIEGIEAARAALTTGN